MLGGGEGEREINQMLICSVTVLSHLGEFGSDLQRHPIVRFPSLLPHALSPCDTRFSPRLSSTAALWAVLVLVCSCLRTMCVFHVMSGTVHTIRPFGMFVALPGFRRHALVHHTQVLSDVLCAFVSVSVSYVIVCLCTCTCMHT